MALLKIVAGGKTFIVDAENKGTAKAHGRSKLEVEVTDATGEDVTQFVMDGGTIEKLAPAVRKAKEDAPAEAAAE